MTTQGESIFAWKVGVEDKQIGVQGSSTVGTLPGVGGMSNAVPRSLKELP
jgi:hypothetical protein